MMMMSTTNSYEFHRSRKLNRSVRAPNADKGHQWWQSVGGLAPDKTTNFGRLRKSYATMRKSFRLQVANDRHRFDFASTRDEEPKLSLMGTLGSGAAKIWRGVRQTKATNDMYSTDGSFKLLSPSGESQRRKSDAEMEIERRLRRSKRRVLTSANYKVPDGGERACEELDMGELEEMKRDNLRQTLIKSQSMLAQSAEKPLDQLGGCSCKDLYNCCTGSGATFNSMNNDCTCLSISSSRSFSSINLQTSETELDNNDKCCSLASATRLARSLSFVGSCTLSGRSQTTQDGQMDVTTPADVGRQRSPVFECDKRAPQRHLDESRASGGFVGDQTSQTLERASPVDELTAERSFGNVCGGGDADNSCANVETLEHTKDSWPTKQQKNRQQQVSNESEQSAGNCCSLGGVFSTASGARFATSAGQQRQDSGREPVLVSVRCESSFDLKQPASNRTSGRSLQTIEPKAADSEQELACPARATSNSSNTESKAKGAGGDDLRAESVISIDTLGQYDGPEQVIDNQIEVQQDASVSISKSTIEQLRKQKKGEMLQVNCEDQTDWRQIAHERMDAAHQQRMLLMRRQQQHVLEPTTCVHYGTNEPDDEHLYASICASSNSPHTLMNQHDEDNEYNYYLSGWRPQSEHIPSENFDQLDNERTLFDKQLNLGLQRPEFRPLPAPNQVHEPRHHKSNLQHKPKKSLFTRLKKLIVPNDEQYKNSSNISEKLESAERDTCKNYHSTRWHQKSATLSSKSTQNLTFASSNRLSTSRKSIDLACAHGDERKALKSTVTNSGFLTFGRRAAKNSKKEDFHQVFIGKNTSMTDRYQGGSVDSLPSADSGLSCSNLQNSASSDDTSYGAIRLAPANLYSNGFNEPRSRVRGRVTGSVTLPVIGRARARVDCNPCAYDKEALVFKRDDLIDILERHPSGTWVGRCNGRVGHFKFINVTELVDWKEEQGDGNDQEDELNNLAKGRVAAAGGGFVTKLEIRSNSTGSEGCGQQSKKTDQENITTTDDLVSDERPMTARDKISGRSKSMGTINQRSVNSNYCEPIDYNNVLQNNSSRIKTTLENSSERANESIMSSSLEQLLFAIGLAGEQVIRTDRREQSRSEIDEVESEQITLQKCFYLDVLNGGGINSLDSFSAINDWQELEQIGIVDDEHQRRLLMAARIIRQASQAAKLDFAEYYQSINRHQAEVETESVSNLHGSTNKIVSKKPVQSAAFDKGTLTHSALTGLTTKTTTCQGEDNVLSRVDNAVKQGEYQQQIDNKLNEPIYVNLINGQPMACQRSQRNLERDLVSGDALSKRASVDNRKQLPGRQARNCPSARKDKRVGEDESINQLDHYESRRNLQGGYSIDSSSCYFDGNDYDNDYSNDDDHYARAGDHRTSNKEDDSPRSQLTRGCSTRISRRRFDFAKRPIQPASRGCAVRRASCTTSSDQFINEEENYQSNRLVSVINEKQVHETNDEQLQIPLYHRADQQERLRPQTRDIINHQNLSIDRQMMNDDVNLRSQINSTSAYDLRLDLSHFFS